MINYPDGSKPKTTKKITSKSKNITKSAANRGMALEKLISAANEYYLMNDMALFTKRPTPINVVKIDYDKGARITNAYFEKQSTTDFNGVYQNQYFDFEAKSTRLKTSFPLNNIYEHQIAHLENVIRHGGIAFFIVEFSAFDEYYVLSATDVIDFYHNGDRKSIPYETFKEKGVLIRLGLNPILDYLPAVIKLFNL